MKSHLLTRVKKTLNQVASLSFNLLMLTFPLNLFLNNFFTTLFIISFGLYLILNNSFIIEQRNSSNIIKVFIFSIPFILTILDVIFISRSIDALRLIERTIPVLFLAFYAVYHYWWFENKIKKSLWFLVGGCLLSACISWGLSLNEIFNQNLPIKALFTQEFAYHNLAAKLGVHTPYLALFINTALGYIVYIFYYEYTSVSKIWLWLFFIILSIFLFNLMARNALFCYLIFGFVFLVKSKQYLLLLTFSMLFVSLLGYIYSVEKNFLRDRFIYGINLFEKQTIFSKKDNRFDRWGVSISIFKENPAIGVGSSNISNHRKEQYIINLDSEAFNENYNAHNQFLEYLSTYGLVGGIGFIVTFVFMFKQAFIKNSYFLLYISSCLLISTFTESIFNRSWGLIYYGVFLIFLFAFREQTKTKENDKPF